METAYYILNNQLSVAHWLSLVAVFVMSMAVSAVVNVVRHHGEKKQGKDRKDRKDAQTVLVALFITYIFFILLLTLIARTPAIDTDGTLLHKAELTPFWSWYEVIVHHDKGLLVEIILNVIFFVPVGILSQLLNASDLFHISLRHVFLFALSLSLFIEITQYFTCRGLMEWDDVIGNACGSVVGWFGCRCIVRWTGLMQ